MEKEQNQPLLHINLLGNPEIRVGDGAPLQLPKKTLALLVYIAIERQMVKRSKLILLFWSDVPDESARSSLRTGLSGLKKALGNYMQATREAIGLDWEKPIIVDAFELDTVLTSESVDLKKADAAIARYRGDFLKDFELKDAPEFDSWCLEQQEHFQQLAFEAFNKLIEDSEQKKSYERAVQYAQQMLNLDQGHEESHYKLIYLYGKQGNRAAALQQYEKCRQILAEILDIEPSEAIEGLIKQVKSGELVQVNESSKISSTNEISTRLKLPTNLIPPAFLTEEEGESRETLFVGRTKELNQLQEALDSIAENKGQVRLVLGNTGQGKSYLLQKFVDQALAAKPELLILTGYCEQQSGAGDPYLPFRHILLLLLGDVEAEWHGGLVSTAHAKRLWEAMGETVPQVVKHAPDLIKSFLTGMPLIERLVVAGLDKEPWFEEVLQLASEKPLGMLEQVRIISLYARVLEAIAKIRPILLILEDAHWIDSSSATLFNYLSRRVATKRILLIGSYRPSEVLANKTHPILEISQELNRLYGDIKINLEDQKVETEREFVNAYLDSEPNELDQNFREAFFKRTQGYALFTSELLNAIKDRGDLYQQEGKWFASDNIDWQTLPAKVEGVIEMRISRLPDRQRELLSVASVQGEAFIGEAVAQVQKQNERDVIRTFSGEIDKRHRLVKSERMERLGKQRLSHYRFRHNLFQQYVYSHLAESERAYLHEDIALALEEMYGKKAKKIAPQLAWHFEQAGNLEKTFEYLLLAGQQAQALGSNREAIIDYERGLALMGQLTITQAIMSNELGFQAGLGMALLPVEGFQSERVSTALERALELCRQVGGTNSQLMTIYAGLAHYALANGNLSIETFLKWSSEYKAIADQQEDLGHRATAISLFMSAHFFLGHINKTIELGRLALSHLNFDQASHENMIRHYTQDHRVVLAPMLSWALCYKGKLKEAKALMANQPVPYLKHAASRAFFLGTAAPIYQCINDFTHLKTLSEELLKIADEYGYFFWKTFGLTYHGWALTQLGEVEKGIAEMRQGINGAKMAGGLTLGSCALTMLAEGLWLGGKYNEALDALEEVFTYSKEKGESFFLSQINRLKGEWIQKLGAEAAEVEQCFRQAIAVAKEQDAPMLELQAALSLAKYWQVSDKQEEIHSLLTELLECITPIVDLEEIPEYAEASKVLAGLRL